MTKPAYQACIAVIRHLSNKGYTEEASARCIRTAIEIEIGADSKTTMKYMMLLVNFGFIKQQGNGIYKILKTIGGNDDAKGKRD